MANSLEVRKELNKLFDKLETLYTPAIFRTILDVDNSLPPWVQNIEVDTYQDFAELRLLGQLQTELPSGSEEKSTQSFPIFAWGSAIQYGDLEVDRAKEMDTVLPVRRANANTMAAEQHLDLIAAVGGVRAQGTTPIGGLLRSAAVTPTAMSGAWVVGTPLAIVDDLYKLLHAVQTTSSQLMSATDIVLPPTRYRIAQRARFGTGDSALTALQVFRNENPQIRIHQWRHAETAGGAFNATRACAFAKREDVARMLIPLELTSYEAQQRDLIWRIPQQLVTGGCLIEMPEGIAYGDGI